MALFARSLPSIGDLIANSIAANRDDWQVENVYMGQVLTNAREGWRIQTIVTWAGDDLSATDIPLNGREERRIWRAIHKLNAHRRDDRRAAAVRRYFCNAASGMEAPSGGETGTGSTEGDSPVANGETPKV